MLLGVDGVGPKVSLSVLSTLTLDTVQRAVYTEESEILSRVPGVGKKTAQKIVLYLHDRLKPADALAKYTGGSGDLKEAAGRNAAYFGVALGELTGTLPALPGPLAAQAQAEMTLIEAHGGWPGAFVTDSRK